MGEISEMMLDGTMCQGCGEWLNEGEDGPGYPGYCSGCEPKNERRAASPKCQAVSAPLGKKLVKTLKSLARYGQTDGSLTPIRGGTMYAGVQWDMASSQHDRLAKRGFVERRSPHNPIHKDRAVITEKGLAFLRERGEIK